MHGFSQFYSTVAWGNMGVFMPLFITVSIWTLILKGFALWYSAKGKQKWWFIVMLVLNTLGILEIIYLIWFRPKQKVDTPPKEAPSPVLPQE